MRVAVLAFAAWAVCVVGARPVAAQGPQRPDPRSERPNRALFGGGLGDVEQVLTISGSAGASADWFSTGAAIDPETPVGLPDGRLPSAEWTGGVGYSTTGRRLAFQASGGLGGRKILRQSRPVLVGNNATAAVQYQLGRTTTLSARGAHLDEPVSISSLLPGAFGGIGTVLPIDYAPGSEVSSTLTQDASVQIAQQVARGTSVMGTFFYRRARLAGTTFERSSRTITVGVSQRVSRYLALRAAYGRGLSSGGEETADETYTYDFSSHIIDVGIDFLRPWSLTRRTQLDVRTGTTALSDGGRTQYALTGSATLSHEVGRTGLLAATYARQADFLETLRAPAISDTATLQWSSLLGRRVELRASTALSFGTIGLGSNGSDYRASASRAGMTVGLNRYLGLTVDYAYDRYRLDDVRAIPVAFNGHFNRSGIRAVVDVWAPVFYRRGRNATR